MAPDAARQALESAVAAAAEAVGPPERGAFLAFASALLAGADARAVRTRGAATLAQLARQAFELVAERAPGELKIRIHAPADRPGRSVALLLQDDRPFLVDTVRLTLRRRGLAEQLLLHPILPAERDAAGRLRSLRGGPGSRRESFIYVELFPHFEAEEERAAFEAELRAALATVADVTDDYPRLASAVRELAANVEAAGRFIPDGAERAPKIRRFLDWLLADHFVLMGFRAYDLAERDGERELRLRSRSGLGMWRDEGSSRFVEPQRGAAIPEEVHRAFDDPRVILISKARIESRIHRAGRLDRVLVKLHEPHDGSGRVSGFAILAGLFTFRALRTPASQVPLLAERLEAILAEEAATPGSHRHKAIVAAFDSAPVEFLLSSDVESNAALIREMVGSEGSEDARLVLRADRDGRSFYAAVLLPRERYSEELRGRIGRLLEERAGASYVDDRVSFLEEGSAVLHFFCTTAANRAVPAETETLEAEIEALTARWEDRLLDALIASCGEAEGPALAARYGPAFPEALRVTTHPADAVRDVAGLEALHARGRAPVQLLLPPGSRVAIRTRRRTRGRGRGGARRDDDGAHLPGPAVAAVGPASPRRPLRHPRRRRAPDPRRGAGPRAGGDQHAPRAASRRRAGGPRRHRAPPLGGARLRRCAASASTTSSTGSCSGPASTGARSTWCGPTSSTSTRSRAPSPGPSCAACCSRTRSPCGSWCVTTRRASRRASRASSAPTPRRGSAAPSRPTATASAR